jgi:putative phosphoribosyl transferase
MASSNSRLTLPFQDRTEAGQMLAQELRAFAARPDVVVCALPRGGVPVGAEIAKSLDVPLTVFMVRKLGVPGHEELAMGALTSGGMRLINRGVVETLGISESRIEGVIYREMQELARREKLYCRGQRMPDVEGRVVILTDDGIATGSTMFLAVESLRRQGAAYIIVAVPVAPAEAISRLRGVADQVICLAEPEPFAAVGEWYHNFRQLTDHEVCQILDELAGRQQPQLKSA